MKAIKENDIFSFRYKSEEIERMGGHWFANHCFDGHLIANRVDGKWSLTDTYWSFGKSSDSRNWSLSEAIKKGTLSLICNLNDIEKIDKHLTQYYDDKDLFNLSYQHNCYEFYAIRKGASRSSEKMLNTLNDKIRKAKSEIESTIREIEQLTEQKTKLESGDLNITVY